jgi:hypothetical protein
MSSCVYKIWILFLFFLMSSCSTLEKNSESQIVLVKSDPIGAEIYLNNQLLSTTPSYIKLKRTRKNQNLKLKFNDEVKELKLQSNFRWVDSGYSNLLFMGFAPLAIGVDFLTGAAWENEEFIYHDFLVQSDKAKAKDKVFVISPPQGENEHWSFEIAERIESFYRKRFPDLRIIPLKLAYNDFYKNGYDFFSRPVLKEQKKVFTALGEKLSADIFVESFYEASNGNIDVYLEEVDAKSMKVVTKHNIYFENDLKTVKKSMWKERAGHTFNFIPNNVSIIAANSHTQLKMTEYPFYSPFIYTAKDVSLDGFLGNTLEVMSSFSLNFLTPPTGRKSLRSEFYFVPSLIFNWNRFEFLGTSVFKEYEFNNFMLGGGYGPQWSLTSKYGKAYLEIIPTLYYNELSWKSDHGKDGSTTNATLGIQSRVGYIYFLNDHLNVSIFVQNTSENRGVWQKVADEISNSPGSVIVDSSTRVFAGFALGYYFPVFENPVGKVYE